MYRAYLNAGQGDAQAKRNVLSDLAGDYSKYHEERLAVEDSLRRLR